jgi:NADH:ubiquinone oxidoreductase subunit F (NADH-binding)
MEVAIAEAKSAGHLGQNVHGSGFNLDIWVHRGAGAYICVEEAGLIESLEGRRGWPRIKPPFPAVEGAFRKPTVVNNVEMLCCVPHVIERGAGWFKSFGVPKSYGPKLYCISGHVNDQTCVKLPLGVTSRELINVHAGGVRIKAGDGRVEDLDIMLQRANTMGIIPGITICGLADGAACPVRNAITKFRDESEDYITTHRKPSVVATALQEAIAHGRSASRSNTSKLDPTMPLV